MARGCILTRGAVVSWRPVLCGVLLGSALGGCPNMQQPGNNDPGTTKIQADPNAANGTFASATTISGAGDTFTIEGEVTARNRLDMFSIGALAAGDRVVIDVQATSGDLDPIASLFDANQDLVGYSDDRADDHTDLNPLIDVVIREATGQSYVGVAPYVDQGGSGQYQAIVTITRGVGAPAPRGQVVWLNYQGGSNIVIPTVNTYNIPAFDAAMLGPTFVGQTALMKSAIKQFVIQRYAGYEFTLLDSDSTPNPPSPHSTIYFGTIDPEQQAFAVSQHIDAYNSDETDVSIIYCVAFQGAFATTPTFAEMSTAVGNVVAHEAGHLLGLVHTEDCDDVMSSDGCDNDTILPPQTFLRAALDPAVFPIGFEDSPELLAVTLGLLP